MPARFWKKSRSWIFVFEMFGLAIISRSHSETFTSAKGLPYSRSTSYGENRYIGSFCLASSKVMSGITTPSERSEERRVGKEWRARWGRWQGKENEERERWRRRAREAGERR